MQTVVNWLDPVLPSRQQNARPALLAVAPEAVVAGALAKLPPMVEAAVGRAKELGQASTSVVSSGWRCFGPSLQN